MGYSVEERLAIVKAICDHMSEGGLAQDAIKKLGITRQSLHNWTEDDSVLLDMYSRARISQAHALAEDTLALANNVEPTKEAVDKARLQVDTRKWFTSKIAAKLYGDKLELSGDPDRPLQLQVWQFGGKEVEF